MIFPNINTNPHVVYLRSRDGAHAKGLVCRHRKIPLLWTASRVLAIGAVLLLTPPVISGHHFALAAEAGTPPPPEILAAEKISEAISQMLRGNHLAANEELHAALTADPNSRTSRYALGMVAEADENWTEAIRWFQEVRSLSPTESKLATEAEQQIQICSENAKQDKQTDSKLDRRYNSMIARARFLVRFGLAKESVAEAAEALQLKPKGWEPYVITAEALALQAQYAKAGEQLELAIERAPDEKKEALHQAELTNSRYANAQKIAAKAIADLRRKDYSEAAAELHEAWSIEHRSNYGIAAAEAYIASGASREAKALLREVSVAGDAEASKPGEDTFGEFPRARGERK